MAIDHVDPTRLSYDVVDVFTDQPYAGNPLAVVQGADGLHKPQLQAIAREFNLSETTFPVPRGGRLGEPVRAYDVRIFTPEDEIPFAGHPTLGTAWMLRRRRALDTDEVVQHCGAGQVDVRVEDRGAELTATPREVGPREDADRLAAAVGLDPDDVAGAAYEASCGLGWAFLRVRPDAVSRSRSLRTGWTLERRGSDPLGGICVLSVEPRGDGLAVHARVYCPEVGVVEDPATGSAAAALGLVLATDGTAADGGTTAYTVEQGAEVGRPSVLRCRVEVAGGEARRVHVAGGVAHVASGGIRVPVVAR